jgi:hypothetical protein
MQLRHIYEYYGSGDLLDIKHIRLHDFIEGCLSYFFETKNICYEKNKRI